MEERPAGCLIAADVPFMWPQGRDALQWWATVILTCPLSGRMGFLQLPMKKQAKAFAERIPLGLEGNAQGGRNPSTSHAQVWGGRRGRSTAKALPFTDQPLQSAPGLGDPTGRKHMHPYATTSLQFESNFWMGNATSALFCSSPSQLQVWSDFPRGKAACL